MHEDEARYAPAAVAQLTGVSTHALRAWERRYGAVAPERTPGGARRYSEREVDRLRLLRRAVDLGHPIGEVARLTDEQVERRIGRVPAAGGDAAAAPPLDDLLEMARTLRVDELERALAMQLSVLGPRRFARDLAGPLLFRIGEAWERGELSVAAEHAASAALRSLLGAALRRDAAAASGPTVVFATPAGERHEFGALIAAIHAFGAGARAVYLGSDLPAEELAAASERAGAHAVALSVVGSDSGSAAAELAELRRQLPAAMPIFLGGRSATNVALPPGVQTLRSLEELENHVPRIPV